MKRRFYTLGILSSVFGLMANVYGTAPAVDDESTEQSHAAAASSQPRAFAEWIEAIKYDRAPADANISNTLTTFPSMRDFAHALTINTSVKKLNLTNCMIGDRSAALLVDALGRNVTLESLNVRENPISGYLLERLLEVAQDHPTLKVVEYDDDFFLSVPSSEDAEAFVREMATKTIEDLIANRAPVVTSIEMYGNDDDMDLDALDEDSAFPKLQRVSTNFPMSVSNLESFTHLMNGAPVLQKLKLKADYIEKFHEDNGQNTAAGKRFLDAVRHAHHLKNAILRVSYYSDEEKYSLFDLTASSFLSEMRSFIETHPSLEAFSLSVPEAELNFTRTFRETRTGPALEGISFYLNDTKKKDLEGLSLVAQSKMANHLVLDFTKGYSSSNMQSVSDVLVHHPFEYVTFASRPGQEVDVTALNCMLKSLKDQKASIELHLSLPTHYIEPVLKCVSEYIPNVRQTTYAYHPHPDQAAVQEHTGRIIGGRSLVERLLPFLGHAPSLRTASQRHIATN